MKRSIGVHFFISLALGGAATHFTLDAMYYSSVFSGVFAAIEIIAIVLNIICGVDKSPEEK